MDMDQFSQKVERDGRQMSLGVTEYRLLEYLMLHPAQVFSREELL